MYEKGFKHVTNMIRNSPPQLDFKVHLRPEEDTKVERETLARKAYSTLSSVPIEYLASNGESMVSC